MDAVGNNAFNNVHFHAVLMWVSFLLSQAFLAPAIRALRKLRSNLDHGWDKFIKT